MPPTPKKKPTFEEISERFHLPLQRAADDMGKYKCDFDLNHVLRYLPNTVEEILSPIRH